MIDQKVFPCVLLAKGHKVISEASFLLLDFLSSFQVFC